MSQSILLHKSTEIETPQSSGQEISNIENDCRHQATNENKTSYEHEKKSTEINLNIPEISKENDRNDLEDKLHDDHSLTKSNLAHNNETRTEHENMDVMEIVPINGDAIPIEVTENTLDVSKETNSNESEAKSNNEDQSETINNLIDSNEELAAESDEIDFISNEQEDEVQINKKSKKFLIDSDSEDELLDKIDNTNKTEDLANKENQSLKMTAKDAIQQRQEIKSESQRMLRETPISLPYHKPKERSITEFLKNRPRLSLLKPLQNIPASAAIKMTTEELKIVTKKMKEREEELRIFYKSESDSEEDYNEGTESIMECENNELIIAETDDIKNHEGVSTINNSSSGDQTAAEARVEVDAPIYIRILDDHKIESNITDLDVDSTNKEQGKDDEPSSSAIQDSLNLNVIVEDAKVQSEDVNVQKESENVENDPNCNSNIEEEEERNTTNAEESDGLYSEEQLSKFEINLSNNTNTEKNKIIIHSILTIPKESKYTLENLDGVEELPVNNLKSQSFLNDDDNAKADFHVDLLKQRESHTPRLIGNGEINLDEDFDVLRFINRIKKQAEVKNIPKSDIKMEIVNLSQGKIHNEIVNVPIDVKEQPIDATDKPALRKQILRNDLKEQIAQDRTKLWKEKQKALEEMTKIDDENTQDKSDYEDNILDDDEDEEENDEHTIDDVDIDEVDIDEDEQEDAETRRIRSAFIDGEAEDSDDNEDMEIEVIEEDEENLEKDDASCDSKSTAKDDINSLTSEPLPLEPKKVLKRIIQVFPEDSDEENTLNEEPSVNITSWDDDDDDGNIPPYQPTTDKTPHKEMTQSKSDITFHTPITQLSALRDLNSGSKVSFTFLYKHLKRITFIVSTRISSIATNTQELISICSGDFSITHNEESEIFKNSEPCTQDLISICSGSFAGLTNNQVDLDVLETINESNDVSENKLINNSQSKYLDEDRIISQLLDEDEMERFKKKFESPITNNSVNNSNSEVKGGGRLVFDSSDDEEEGNNATIKLSKHKKLHFSDDDSESEEENGESDESIDLRDNFEDLDDATNKEINYDSEENEIEVPKNKYKPSDFFEKEAELSESDWDSDDEDERGLDNLEQEQGDNELFDENKLKNDLERIHMRNVLDQDNREIKMLQELLLEDGELHGTSRQRQFRWKNIDDNANDDKGPIDGDEIYLDEDENEEQWRKLRHEREMFLKILLQQTSEQDEDCLDSILSDSNSQVFKIGQQALRRSVSNASGQSDKDKTVSSSDALRKVPALTNTRGSFLARSNNFLTRLADITKVNSTTSVIKTSTKIVFQTSTSLDENNLNNNKRKADDGTPIAIKKLRLSSNISPSLKGSDRKKKLF
ncbi:hypothetical protein FQR65_LT00771 [Abscondita terminalis]|nr:hypothetical protein FQR65_LT00771 [Abscondita terminalis]